MRRALAIGFSSLLLLHRVASDDAAVPGKDSSGSSLSSGRRFVVDDDSVQCPSADFTTIGEAVDAASSGDTILVCAGNYPEGVRVDKTLHLLGAQHGRDARSRSSTIDEESVVGTDVPFSLGADNIVLDGFTVSVVLSDGEGHGILTGNLSSGYQIINNRIDADGVTGLFPGSNGVTQTLVRHNFFTNRFGIATSDDEPAVFAHNLLLTENLFVDSSVLLASGSDADVHVINNTFLGNSRISVVDAHRVEIRKNKLFDPTSPDPEAAALLIGRSCCIPRAPNDDILVKDNLLRNGEGIGIGVFSGSNVRVRNNRLAGFRGAGVLLRGVSGVRVQKNEIDDGAGGITLENAENNVVCSNSVEDNSGVGIDVSADSKGNRFRSNESRGNDPLDCREASLGDGTLRIANSWVRNEGSRSEPEGICKDHP